MNIDLWSPARLAAFLAMATTFAHAQADLKVVSNVAVTGATSGTATAGHDGKSTVTSYYKGSKMRAESADGAKVTIYDGSQAYVIDPKAKTYYAVDPKGGSGSFTLTPDIKVDKTSDTKSIAGHPSNRYALSGSIQIQPGAGGGQATGRRQGGGRRGGLGGGGGAGRARAGGGAGSLAFKVDGDLWATTDVQTSTTSALQILAGSSMPALQSVFQQIGTSMANAGLILGGTFKIDPPSVAASRMGTITVTIEAMSVEQTTLDDNLFKVPDGYQKVDPPARGAVRGFGGRGGGQ